MYMCVCVCVCVCARARFGYSFCSLSTDLIRLGRIDAKYNTDYDNDESKQPCTRVLYIQTEPYVSTGRQLET